MGPDRATDAIGKALSMGADSAVHLSDEALAGACELSLSPEEVSSATSSMGGN
jgi:electron transfer flavoprotein alpha/beta subunit